MKLKLFAVLLVVGSMSCSLAFQRSVRSSSVYCSTSRFWYLTDLLLAGTYTYVIATKATVGAEGYIPTAVFGGSGLLGIYKRSNCVKWQKEAPPEVWAAAAEAARQQAEADARAYAEAQAQREAALALALQQQQEQLLLQQQQQQQQPEPQPYPQPPSPGPVPQPQPAPQPITPITPTITITRLSSTDELGKSCKSQPGWPSAQTCQYGAVCYANQCTVWCGTNDSCPAGYRCAFTDENPRTKLCRR